MRAIRCLLLCVPVGVASAGTTRAASDVLRFTLPRSVEGRWDMEVILFHRDGVFHHGYALVPGRDNVPHRVDVTPSRPIRWEWADGTPLDVPEKMRGYYSYKVKPDFEQYKKRFAEGKIRVAHPVPTPPITWADGKLRGTVDVLIAPVSVANRTGRRPTDIAYRVVVNAAGRAGGPLHGTASWWTYRAKDDDYAPEAARTTVELAAARWDADYWKPAPAAELAPGAAWPQARGPDLTGAAPPCRQALVDNLDDARLLWVGEEIIGGGRGAVLSRGDFAMYPYAWQNIAYGGFAGVTVADGKVFQYLIHPDEQRVAADPEIAANVYVQLGADPRTLANRRGHMRDTVLCLDARTGRTLWWFRSQRTFGNVRSGKAGVGMTACWYRGRLYARGSGGLYCLDAATGRLLWLRTGWKSGRAKVNYAPSGGWSHDESPVIIGGVLVMGHGEESLAGVDVADGRLLWTHEKIKGQNAVPTKVTLDGREFVIVSSREPAALSLIDPADGRILWRSGLLGPNHGSLAVWGDIVCGNCADRAKRKQGLARAVRVGTDGAKLLWTSKEAGYPPHRSVPVAHDGCFYIDDREGFFCIEAETGRILRRQPHIYTMTGGSHNWVWTIATGRLVLTSGVIAFSTGADGFRRLGGRVSLDLADGYTCPIKPALADGRLFCRLADKIVCYDLRKDPARKVRTAELVAPRAFAGSTDPAGTVRIRIRAGDGAVTRAAAAWPEVVGPEADRVPEKWAAGYTRPLTWRSGPAPDLVFEAGDISGRIELPMGWHVEHWTLNLRRDGRTLQGTFTRSVPALRAPLAVRGTVSGTGFETPEGPCCVLVLDAAATQLRRNEQRQAVTVVVVRGRQGTRAWAVAGRINSMAHEVDPSGLAFADDGGISGTVTVLFRDDRYFHLNPAAGTAIAATYRLDAVIRDGAIAGTHTGTFGHAWRRQGTVHGVLLER